MPEMAKQSKLNRRCWFIQAMSDAMIRWRRLTALTALAGGLLLASPAVEAAPQILGLVASNGTPTPLRCEDGICRGVVDSFCLQNNRDSPRVNSEYRLAPGGGLTIAATRKAGSVIRLPGENLVSLRSRNGFSSVTVSLPESHLKALGGVSLAIEIAPLTSALPATLAGDSNPQTPEEIAHATGTLRRLAERIFDDPGETSDAARVAALVINSLPADEPRTAAAREAMWHQTLMLVSGAPLDPRGIAKAEGMFRNCGAAVDSHRAHDLKVCMELEQSNLIGDMELERIAARAAPSGGLAGANGS